MHNQSHSLGAGQLEARVGVWPGWGQGTPCPLCAGAQSCGKAGAFCERGRQLLENDLLHPLTVTLMTESGSEDTGPDLALRAHANDNTCESSPWVRLFMYMASFHPPHSLVSMTVISVLPMRDSGTSRVTGANVDSWGSEGVGSQVPLHPCSPSAETEQKPRSLDPHPTPLLLYQATTPSLSRSNFAKGKLGRLHRGGDI